MTVAVTTLRASIASALSNAGVWDTFSYVPATPTANSVVLRYADPMLEPSNNQYNVGAKANFTFGIAGSSRDDGQHNQHKHTNNLELNNDTYRRGHCLS